MQRQLALAMAGLLLVASPAFADVTYCIALPDADAATVATQTDKLNAERRVSKGSPPDITPTQLLQRVIQGTVGHWGVARGPGGARADPGEAEVDYSSSIGSVRRRRSISVNRCSIAASLCSSSDGLSSIGLKQSPP